MAAKKFYAVAVGRVPGIYASWPATQAQVSAFPGARFKGFTDRLEAEAWLKNPAWSARSDKGRSSAPQSAAPTISAASPGAVGDALLIYTDGGAIGNPGPGGYGAVLIVDGERRELSGGFRHTTNNRMELMACIVAIQSLPCRDRKIQLYTDSSYVANGISKGWAKGWRKRAWVKSDGQPAQNPDLWAKLLDLIDGLSISFHWVKGHAGNPMNERCDALAVAAARRPHLPVDSGYEGR